MESIKKKFLNFFSITLITAFLSILTIYILTTELTVEIFATYALFFTFVAFSNGIIASYLTYIFSRNTKKISDDEMWTEVYSSSLFLLVLVLVLYVLIFICFLFLYKELIILYKNQIILSLIKIIFDSFQSIYLEYFRVKGDSINWSKLSLIIILSNTFLTYILFYFSFDFNILLFIGPAFSSVFSFLFISFNYINFKKININFNSIDFSLIKTSLLSSSLENFNNFFEKFFLTKQLGLYQFGIYNHSLSYKQYFGLVGNTFANTIWAVSLKEAVSNVKKFNETRKTWNLYYFLLFIATVLSVFFSEFFLNVITNGVFNEAKDYIPLLLMCFFIINSGKEDMAFLFSHNFGNFLNNSNSMRIVVFIVMLVLSVPFMKIYGAIFSLIVSNSVYRIIVYLKVKSIMKSNYFINYNYNWIPFLIISVCIYTLSFFFEYVNLILLFLIAGLIFGLYINAKTLKLKLISKNHE